MLDVLMATYNGEKYLRKQIDSILDQTYTTWKLYIRDDGSKDGTLDIINEYVKSFPNKIIHVKSECKNMGAKNNFLKLLESSNADYICFADQDDIWHKNKLMETLNLMSRIEDANGKSIPILVHTDVVLVRDNEEIISNSFWDYSKINGMEQRFNRILVQNNITGCTVCINKTLAQMSIHYNDSIIMHDWWFGLIASAFGVVQALNQQTMYYRQHSNNEVGAKDFSSIKYKISMINNTLNMKNSISRTIEQASIFLKLFGKNLSEENKNVLEKYCNIRKYNKLRRLYVVFSEGFFKYGTIRNIAYCIFI